LNFATPFQSPHPTIHEEEDDNNEYNIDKDDSGEGKGWGKRGKGTVGQCLPQQRERIPPLLWGVSKMNGWRIDMEDRRLVEYNALAGFGMFKVFDGHGDGGHASGYVARYLRGILTSRPKWASAYRARDPDLLASLIVSACHDLTEGLRGDASRPARDGKTTAIIALVCNRHLVVANVGDRHYILVRKKKER
jgi:hypothetical protein